MAAKYFVLLCCCNLFAKYAQGYMVDGDPYRRADFVDSDEKYHLEWKVDFDQKRITFNVTVKTQGWVLFGLANNASIETGRDVVIGGVMGREGGAYFSDRHEEGNDISQIAIVDTTQDYKLENAWERRGETFLSFSRSLDTCDSEDYPISNNKVTVIWAYGDYDNYDIHRREGPRQRGIYEAYLLEPEYTPRIVRDAVGNPRIIGDPNSTAQNRLQLWTIAETKTIMPANHTSYLCTIHKAPRLSKKHHIVGFDIHLPDPQSKEHVHHFIVYKCNAPRGSTDKQLFDPWVGAPAQSCFFNGRPSSNPRDMPSHFCEQVHSGWALGGRAFFFPPQAGIPLGQNPDEYLLVQVHYDNPQLKRNVQVSVQMDVWYTHLLRRNDAGFMATGVEILPLPPSIVVPPKSTDHRVIGHCSPECTQRMFPPQGITVFASILHSHNSGKRMRLRHFDMEKKLELPWITFDDNYSNRFQQIRHLRDEVRILPGDQLTTECTYDNTWTNGSVVGGFSTAQEMCVGFIFYYGQVRDYSQCRSQIVSEEGRRRFLGGLANMTYDEDRVDWVATTPRHLAGLTVTEISDRMPWDGRTRAELQRYHEVTPAVGSCSRELFARSRASMRAEVENRSQSPWVYPNTDVNTENDWFGLVEYPFDAKAYVPESGSQCPKY